MLALLNHRQNLNRRWNDATARERRLALLAVFILSLTFTYAGPAWLQTIPTWLTFPVSEFVGKWLTYFARESTLLGIPVQSITRGLAEAVDKPIEATVTLISTGWFQGNGLNRVQSTPPLSWFAVTGALCLLAYRLDKHRLLITVFIGLMFLVVFGLWKNAMVTLASVLVSIVLTVILGSAIGILAFKRPKIEALVRAIMNVLQTLPIFAYLIPTLLLFGYGPAAALIATVAYALPPMVHNCVLGLKSVPDELVEMGHISGCTPKQLLWRIQFPTAIKYVAVGLNQATMMTLNMVIIASMIGAGGLGFDVLTALRKLDIGSGLEAGIGIVALAVVLDRLTQAWARQAAQGRKRQSNEKPIGLIMIAWLVLASLTAYFVSPLQSWPSAWTVSTAEFWNGLVTWMNVALFDTLEKFRGFLLLEIMRPFRDFLAVTPWSAVILVIGWVAFLTGGRITAAYTVALMMFIVVTGYWLPAMNSVYLMTLSVLLALLIGFPLGVWLAKYPRLSSPANLVLDTLQTLPTLVYILPAVMLFRIGDVSAIIAIFLYALAPAVRYSMIAIQHAPASRLEVAQITGCTRWQTFLHIRLPAAAKTLILGINQTVMMAFSMLVIAALVGTKDLGQQVLIALNRNIVGQGIVAGLCVAALALMLDALLKAAAKKVDVES